LRRWHGRLSPCNAVGSASSQGHMQPAGGRELDLFAELLQISKLLLAEVERFAELFQISKLLLAEEDAERTPELLLRRLIESCGAETGFVVVREEGSFRQKVDAGYHRRQVSSGGRALLCRPR